MEEFAFIYDIIAVAILGGMLFAGFKKGFAGAVVSVAAVFVAFSLAMTLSAPLSTSLYTSLVEEKLESAVDKTLDESMGSVTLSGMSALDYDKVRISGVPVGEIQPNYAGTSKALVELSELDLSETGIENVDLSVFGISSDIDFSNVSGKTADFTKADIEKYGLGRLAVAQFVAVSAMESEFFSAFCDYTETVGETLPMIFGNNADEIVTGSVSAIRSVVLIMAETSSSVKTAIINGIIEPTFIMATRTVIFIVIFAVVSIVLGLIASALKFVNKIPVLGGMNAVLGGAVGLVEGVITLCVVCIVARMIISLSGGNIVFMNEATIDSTLLFRVFYNFDFLNFLT